MHYIHKIIQFSKNNINRKIDNNFKMFKLKLVNCNNRINRFYKIKKNKIYYNKMNKIN